MPNIERRTFLGAAMAALPLAVMGQSIETSTLVRAVRVACWRGPIWRRAYARCQLNRFQGVNSRQQRLSLHHGAYESEERWATASFAPQ